MRRLLPLALLLVACSKPQEAPVVAETPAAPKIVNTDQTPEGMAKEMEIPMYPGSEAPQGMSSIPERRDDGSTHFSLVLVTPDAPAKVAGWYEKTLGLSAMGGSIVGKTKGGNDAIVTVAPEAGRTMIRVKAIKYAKKGS